MNKGLGHQAYTIVEVMIFLAVSSALLVSAFALINGQQQKTQFTQAANDIRQQIDDVINNVASGYYPSLNNFTCKDAGSGKPEITAPAANQGSNKGCIYVGRAMQFVVDYKKNSFNIYSLAGLQYEDLTNSIPAITLAKVAPIALTGSSIKHPLPIDTADHKGLQYGIEAAKMTYVSGGVPATTAVVVFMSSFGQYNPSTSLLSGSQQVNLYAVAGTDITDPLLASQDNAIDSMYKGAGIVPADEVDICFEGGINQTATVVIGSNGRQISTILNRGNGTC